MNSGTYQLPQKIPNYIRRLEIMYKAEGHELLHEVLCSSSIFIREGVEYDNWDGGITGHRIILFLSEHTFQKIGDFDKQSELLERLRDDLQKCSQSIDDEFISSAVFELNDENDVEFQNSINPLKQPIINPDSVNIWNKGYIRLFISHRDAYKKQANELADALEGYGISAFVAHDTIKPMEEWQDTIRKGLQTMEIMLAFITDDFSESVWTNQEIGVAIGRGIPIISLKLEQADPSGFLAHVQALKGDIDNPADAFSGIYDLLCEKLGKEERIRKAAVKAFVRSQNFDEAGLRFKRLQKLKTLSSGDVQTIIDGFHENESIHGAYYLINNYNRLCGFLKNRTGQNYKIENNRLVLFEENDEEEIPF